MSVSVVPAPAADPVPLGQQAPPPAETLSGVPPWDTTAGTADAPTGQTMGGSEDLVIGIAAAAGYLGYVKPDSFRRARTRRPHPRRNPHPDGRPAWTPRSLRNWHAQRTVIGNRTTDRGPDSD